LSLKLSIFESIALNPASFIPVTDKIPSAIPIIGFTFKATNAAGTTETFIIALAGILFDTYLF
jgi:hypothetical protein